MSELELELLLLSARMTTGYAGWKDAEAVGLKLLLSGLEGPAVVALASVSSDEGNLPTLVSETLSELGLPEPTVIQAGAVRQNDVARQVIENGLDPYEGAKKVRNLAYDFPELDSEMTPYAAMIDGYEDEEGFREAYAKHIVEHFRAILNVDIFPDSPRASDPKP